VETQKFQHASSEVPAKLQEGRFQEGSNTVPTNPTIQHRSDKIPEGSTKVPGRFQHGSRKAPARFQHGSSTVPARFQQGSGKGVVRFQDCSGFSGETQQNRCWEFMI